TDVQPAVGWSFFMTVNVTGMPAFNGYNILVKVNTAAITITSISSARVMFASPSEDINCVNNVGTGCVAGLDGAGIAHNEVFCLGCFTTSDHGELFNITFTGIRSPTATGTVVALYNVQIDKPPILVHHVDVDGLIGTTHPTLRMYASPFSPTIPPCNIA